jgi:carboxylesterase
MKLIHYSFSLSLLFIVFSCNPTPDIDDKTMLDGNQIFDLSLSKPEKYLISAAIPNPTETQKNIPVLIAAHGYTATTFEWDELRTYADSAQTFYLSQVLLGGHGQTYEDFKKSSWQDWQSSITEEYIKLSQLGFKHIYLAGSSTGAPLIVQLFVSDFFKNKTEPKGVFLIDPIVVSSNKTLTLVGLLGPVLGYTTVELSGGEKGKWYVYRPQETLKELLAVIDKTRKDLEKGIKLTNGTKLKIYKSEIDATADPVSAVMLFKGIKDSNNKNVDIEMVPSDLHVYTRLKGRDTIIKHDYELQQKTFKDFESLMRRN